MLSTGGESREWTVVRAAGLGEAGKCGPVLRCQPPGTSKLLCCPSGRLWVSPYWPHFLRLFLTSPHHQLLERSFKGNSGRHIHAPNAESHSATPVSSFLKAGGLEPVTSSLTQCGCECSHRLLSSQRKDAMKMLGDNTAIKNDLFLHQGESFFYHKAFPAMWISFLKLFLFLFFQCGFFF